MSAPCEQRHSVIREVISLVITKVISLILSQASNCWEENTQPLHWREHLELQCCNNPPTGLTLLPPVWEAASDIANGVVWRKNNPKRSACQRSCAQKPLSHLPMTSKSACAVVRGGPRAADSPAVMWYLLQRLYIPLRLLGAPFG